MKNENQSESGLVIIEHANYADAVSAASGDAATSMAATCPAILYRQAGRVFISTAFPIGFVAEKVKVDDIKKGGDPSMHFNRPIDPAHSRAISVYLQTEQEYFLPALSLCLQGQLRCHVPKTNAAVKLGFVILPVDVYFSVSDGSHRVKAITDAISKMERLRDDGVAATIVCESDIDRVHRDFFDASQSKSISPSLLNSFNMRSPLARLVREVCSEVPVFKDRIERVAKTVGKSDTLLYTANQVKQAVGELVLGNSLQASRIKTGEASRLGDEAVMAEHKRMVLDFFNSFAAFNEQWASLLAPSDPEQAPIDTSALREEFVSCTATGLIVIGRVGHAILGYPEPERKRLIQALAREIDWRRSGEIWRDSIIVAGGRMVTQRTPLELAAIRVKQQMGLPLLKVEQNLLQRIGESAAA